MEPSPLSVRIDSLAYGGDGVGTLPGGKRVFVPGTAPGDLVELEVVSERARHAHARLVRLLEAGPPRVRPACPHAGRCGGCQLQHLAPEAQRRAKEEAFWAGLARLGGVERDAVPRPHAIVPSPEDLHYRCRCSLQVRRRELGFFARRSRELVPLETCPLLEPPLEALARATAEALRTRRIQGLRAVDLCVGADGHGAAALRLDRPPARGTRRAAEALLAAVPALHGAVLAGEGGPVIVLGDPVVLRPAPAAPGLTLRGRPDVFAQANAGATPGLAARARDLLRIEPGSRVLELHAGAGTLSLALAAAGARLTAVETSPEALSLLGASAREAGLSGRVVAVEGDAVSVCRGLAAEGRRFERALLDPPRTGERTLPAALAELGVERVVYVSCDPTTLARDVAAFVRLGYAVTDAGPLDLFPQTYHLEGLVALQRA